MRKLLWYVVLLALATAVSAQQGVLLRSINEYGPTYHPQLAEDLRLLEPSNVTRPEFGTYDYNEILTATLVSGQYYLEMAKYYKADLGTQGIDVKEAVKARARAICEVNGTPQKRAELDCLRFYGEMGNRAYELSKIPTYGACRGNTQSALNTINEAYSAGNVTDIQASLEYSVRATGLKWCQAYFGEPFTVVPPTAENTKVTAPPQPIVEPDSERESPFKSWMNYAAGAIIVILAVILVVRGRKHKAHKHP